MDSLTPAAIGASGTGGHSFLGFPGYLAGWRDGIQAKKCWELEAQAPGGKAEVQVGTDGVCWHHQLDLHKCFQGWP